MRTVRSASIGIARVEAAAAAPIDEDNQTLGLTGQCQVFAQFNVSGRNSDRNGCALNTTWIRLRDFAGFPTRSSLQRFYGARAIVMEYCIELVRNARL